MKRKQALFSHKCHFARFNPQAKITYDKANEIQKFQEAQLKALKKALGLAPDAPDSFVVYFYQEVYQTICATIDYEQWSKNVLAVHA